MINKQTNKMRIILLCVIGTLIILGIALGLTYAFMRPQVEKEEKSNINIKACAKVQLKDTNSNSINLKNTYPIDDSLGLETEPYEFTINSTCENYVGFNLYLTSLTSNEIADEAIRYALATKDNTVLTSGILANATNALTEFSSEELKELDSGIKGTHKNVYKVFSNNISLKGESEYKLYLWVDKDASNDTMGKSFKVGLSIKSYNRKETLAEYLIKNKDETLIYHDGMCDYEDEENCDLEVGDFNYRFVGTNPDNYVCFGSSLDNCPNDNLYRIIGLFKNELNLYEIKLIKADYANSDLLGKGANTPGETVDYETDGSYYTYATYGPKLNSKNNHQEQDAFSHRYRGSLEAVDRYRWQENGSEDTTADWPKALLNTIHLNHNFLNSFEEKWQDKITNHDWKYKGDAWGEIAVGSKNSDKNIKTVYDHELGKDSDPTTCNAKIGLMYVTDYLYAASPNNWTKWPYNGIYTYKENGTDSENVPTGTYDGTDGTDYKNAIEENWMYMGLWEWTITQRTDNSGVTAFDVHVAGSVNGTCYVGTVTHVVRPSFYLSSNEMLKGGAGLASDPYLIS